MKLKKVEHIGKKPCFCVSTDSHKYKVCGLTHHNSVTTQSIIYHCLEHSNEIALGLVDIKQVEYTNYKGMNGIVGVANTVEEACELLRVCRAVMYKRNKEMAKLGIKKIEEYTPHKKTGKVWITGREYNEDDMIKVKIDGEEKQMRASEVIDYLNETSEEVQIDKKESKK